MHRLTTFFIAMTLGASGFAAAQEAPVNGLGYNPPIVRTDHDSKPKHFGVPGRQVRGGHVRSQADFGGAIDTRTTASIEAGVNSNHQPHRPYGNYGPQITEWDVRSGSR